MDYCTLKSRILVHHSLLDKGWMKLSKGVKWYARVNEMIFVLAVFVYGDEGSGEMFQRVTNLEVILLHTPVFCTQ